MDKKWNLQDIKPAGAKKKRPSVSKQAQTESSTPKVSNWSSNKKTSTKGSKSHLLTAIIIFLVILGGGFGISALMDGAKVTVYPRHREPTVNSTFTAYRDSTPGELSYEIMTLEADGERQVTATGQEEVNEQATGVITIYKTTSGSERLIKNTRFRTPDGKVYRITESAVVPGGTSDQPGSVNADVFADEAGEEYNLEAGVRFDVPGFEEGGSTELFNAIYAENPAPITGGYSGPKFTVDDAELDTAVDELHNELKEALMARVNSEKPAGFVVFEDAITMVYNSLPSEQAGENQVKVKERANLQIPIFKQEDFAKFIASGTIPGYEGQSVRIDNLEDLSFSYTASTTPETNIATAESINFRLSGTPLIVWTFDEESLKADLLGSSRTALNTILGGYPAIERAGAVVRPFWKRTFPNKLDDISVIESLEEKTEE